MKRYISVLNVPLEIPDETTVHSRIIDLLESREKGMIGLVNPVLMKKAQTDIELHKALLALDLILPNSLTMGKATEMLCGESVPIYSNANVLHALQKLMSETGCRTAAVVPEGTDAGLFHRAMHQLLGRDDWSGVIETKPDLVTAGAQDGVVERLREWAAEVVLVSGPSPFREKWLLQNYDRVTARLFWLLPPVGKWFDKDKSNGKFHWKNLRSGWANWLDPIDCEFVEQVRKQTNQLKYLRAGGSADGAEENAYSGWHRMVLGTYLTSSAVRKNGQHWMEEWDRDTHLMVDLTGVVKVDSEGLGFLIRLHKAARNHRREMMLLSPPEDLMKMLKLVKLDFIFRCADDEESAKIEGDLRAAGSRIGTSPRGESLVVRWSGQVTGAEVPRIERETMEQFRAFTKHHTFAHLGVDLSGVDFVDSAGLGLMVRIRKWASKERRPLAFKGASDRVRQVIRLTQLDRILLG